MVEGGGGGIRVITVGVMMEGRWGVLGWWWSV